MDPIWTSLVLTSLDYPGGGPLPICRGLYWPEALPMDVSLGIYVFLSNSDNELQLPGYSHVSPEGSTSNPGSAYNIPVNFTRSEIVARLNVCSRGDKSLLTLQVLIDRFSESLAMDPRDGIFALLPLASDIDHSHPKWFPDYSSSKPVMDIFEEAFWHIVRTTRSLDIMCRSMPERNLDDTHCTWIPWFGGSKIEAGSQNILARYNSRSLTNFGEYAWLFPDEKTYCASGRGSQPFARRMVPEHTGKDNGKGPASWVESKARLLYLRGWVVDEVKVVGPPLARKLVNGQEKTVIPYSWIRMLGLQPPQDLDKVPDAFCRSITGNRITKVTATSIHAERAPESWPEAVRDFMRLMMPGSRTTKDRLLMKEVGGALEFMGSSNRRFAITESSMGFVPFDAEPGDKICILDGVSVPVVLREIDLDDAGVSTMVPYRFVGECYVDGYMEGEYVEEVEEHQPPKQLFLLF
ncbi:hypothetical protein GQ53DRAFT_820075 [Thozetella sp. PMI_491]|nr:hypothetical protein GQ53DRAFT_820075 [Thozetella sp. PMI_491]